MNKKIVLVTGGFDPIHSGHIAYFKTAKSLGDTLVVGINSDDWLVRKKGKAFMPLAERQEIIKNLSMVDYIITFNDSDGSAKQAIKTALDTWPQDKIIFANGGDRTPINIPEMDIQNNNLEFAFGIGGEDKKNSSSWILEEWKAPKTDRAWGYYRNLHNYGTEVKVKELTVEPGKCLSMQKHSQRAEHWFVAEGTATVYTLNRSTDMELRGVYYKFDSLHINTTEWHQLCNESDSPLKIVEIQYGENCIEEDIERK
jgi:D-beta-D-heptose 7-phosphate kinase/D-beta-D-heptose 1-phosphate adenosyltransferase